jgi:putative SOS response-associated peptidase YedK
MCGRYYLAEGEPQLRAQFDLDAFGFEWQPRYNIAPQQPVPIIVAHRGRHAIGLVRWGLVPSWAETENVGLSTINARAETIATKPAFRDAFRLRRCIVPASGFYEWRKDADGHRTPHAVQPAAGGPVAFAGLWEKWRAPDGRTVTTCTIVTTEAAPAIRPIHDRMPVILDRAAQQLWLDPDTDLETLAGLLEEPPDACLQAYVVSRLVNSVRNDSPDCLLPAADEYVPDLFAG